MIVNEGELKDLLGVKFKTIEELIESLSKDAVLIVTKGENGSTTHRKGGNVVNCDAEACSVIDSTGAGDCFLVSTSLTPNFEKVDEAFEV